MAGKHRKVRARKGVNKVLGSVLMTLRVTRALGELARLYTQACEVMTDGQSGGEDGPGSHDSPAGGEGSVVEGPPAGGDVPDTGVDLPDSGLDTGFSVGYFDWPSGGFSL